MLKILLSVVTVVIAANAQNDKLVDEIRNVEPETSTIPPKTNTTKNEVEENADIVKDLSKFVDLVAKAEKLEDEGMLSKEEIDHIYNNMTHILIHLNDLVSNPTNVFKFLNANGIDKIIKPHLQIENVKLKWKILNLFKSLFENALLTTTTTVPKELVDKIVMIFEKDADVGTRNLALDILCLWLPGNPKVQTRVLRVKGLEAFYNQLNELDGESLHKLLQLFVKILLEHIDARNDRENKTTEQDKELLRTYQKIGLLERLATSTMCYGLADIFEVAYSFRIMHENIMLPVFKLMEIVQPYCMKYYRRKWKSRMFFNDVNQYVSENDTLARFEKSGANSTQIKKVVEYYIIALKKKNVPDEL